MVKCFITLVHVANLKTPAIYQGILTLENVAAVVNYNSISIILAPGDQSLNLYLNALYFFNTLSN